MTHQMSSWITVLYTVSVADCYNAMHWCSICTLTWTNMGHVQLLFGTLSGIHFLACDSNISNVVRPKGRISFWLSCPCLVLLPFGILEYSWIACSQFLETLEVRSNPGGISRCPDLQVAAVICLTCLQSCDMCKKEHKYRWQIPQLHDCWFQVGNCKTHLTQPHPPHPTTM
jgi:hypothetical protein